MQWSKNILVLTPSEKEVYNLIITGKNQTEISNDLKKSRPYINQVTKRLEAFEAIVVRDIKPVKTYYANPNGAKFCVFKKTKQKRGKCQFCGNTIYSNNKEAKFCSKYCYARSLDGPKSPNWRGGKKYEPYCWKFNEDLKERVRNFFGRICFACGDKEQGKKLAVHHMTYNKMACCDGKDNPLFIPLCEDCHNTVSRINNKYFIERLFYNQLMIRTGGKCFISQEELLEEIHNGS